MALSIETAVAAPVERTSRISVSVGPARPIPRRIGPILSKCAGRMILQTADVRASNRFRKNETWEAGAESYAHNQADDSPRAGERQDAEVGRAYCGDEQQHAEYELGD